MPNTTVAQTVRWVRSQVRGVPTHILIWTLIASSVTLCLLQGLQNRNKHTERTPLTYMAAGNDHRDNVPDDSSDHCGKSDEQQTAEEEEKKEDGQDSEDEVEEGGGEEKEDACDDEED